MILMTGFVLGALSIVYILAFTDWINFWYDSWILVLAFLAVSMTFIIMYILFFVILSLFVDVSKPLNKPKKLYDRFVKRIAELIIQISRAQVHVRGLHKIPHEAKFLLVSNHQSMLDPVILVWTLRYWQMPFIMKDSLKKIPIANRWLYAIGCLSLDRSNAREGMKVINQAIEKIENNVSSISVFPEGTRSKTGEIIPFHHGSFRIAIKSHCPIVVVVVKNTRHIKKRFFFRSTKVYVDVIDVLDYQQYQDMSTQELSTYTENIIKEGLKQLPEYNEKLKGENNDIEKN